MDLHRFAREVAIASGFVYKLPCKDGGIIIVCHSCHRVGPREDRLGQSKTSILMLLELASFD